MIKKICLPIAASIVVYTTQAQTPWSKMPATKQVVDKEGEEVTATLVVDTLKQLRADSTAKTTINFFYDSDVDLIGYGYKDVKGNPYGTWRYYTRKGSGYQRSCEGYYKLLLPDDLVVERDIIDRFPYSNSTEAKSNFVNTLSDKLFFTGEWRFYKDDRLEKIIILNEDVALPYHLSLVLLNESKPGREDKFATQLSHLVPTNRLSGNMNLFLQFSKTGVIKLCMEPE